MRERVKRGECYKMRARKKRKLIMGRSLNHRNKSLISMVEKWIGGKEMGPGYILNTWKAFSLKGSREMWGTYELAQFFIWKIWVGLENARKGTNRRGDKTNEAMSWFLKKKKKNTRCKQNQEQSNRSIWNGRITLHCSLEKGILIRAYKYASVGIDAGHLGISYPKCSIFLSKVGCKVSWREK